MHVPEPPATPEPPIWLEEKAPVVFPTLLAINGLKLAVIFGQFPNITGKSHTVGLIYGDFPMWDSGCFLDSTTYSVKFSTSDGIRGLNLNFTASKSNALYGSSDTNQPKSLRSLCLIRAYEV